MVACIYLYGGVCTCDDSENYDSECVREEDNEYCFEYIPDWIYPCYCKTCTLNYGSDKCAGCATGKPSNYVSNH